MMISVIKWNENIEEAPEDTYLLLYIEDNSADKIFKYVSIAWKTSGGNWIMDNDYIYGNIIAWANFPDPSNMTIAD